MVLEYPMYVKFVDEAGVDEGGVQWDMFTAFWDDCYLQLFEGVTTVIPIVHPQISISVYAVIGRIISLNWIKLLTIQSLIHDYFPHLINGLYISSCMGVDHKTKNLT